MMGKGKDGIFSPVVKLTKRLVGEKRFLPFRAKVIAAHTKVIQAFVETSDSPFGCIALEKLFELADENNDGTISREELEKALKKLGFSHLKGAQIDQILARADADDNCVIARTRADDAGRGDAAVATGLSRRRRGGDADQRRYPRDDAAATTQIGGGTLAATRRRRRGSAAGRPPPRAGLRRVCQGGAQDAQDQPRQAREKQRGRARLSVLRSHLPGYHLCRLEAPGLYSHV